MTSPGDHLLPALDDSSAHLWDARYRLVDRLGGTERGIEESWQRVAPAVAAAEPSDAENWAERYFGLMRDFAFLPGGRILAGAGARRTVTLFNCFVMGVIEDSIKGIFRALQEGAVTMQQGGGVGYDFSTLRPRGALARQSGTIASGPVSFMRVWDAMCATILETGARRGAMMATLRCDHPDIEAFIDAKKEAGALTHFNLSVLVSDAFLEAVRSDAEWVLKFPAQPDEMEEETVESTWPGQPGPTACRIYRRVSARELWRSLLAASHQYSEPGVLFVDRINRENNLAYCEQISATNPCGELPLPPYGACDLGSLNLTRFVRHPFTERAGIDEEALSAAAATATRFLDTVIDISHFPLSQQREAALASRRIGLGITGLADALVMLGLDYRSPAARGMAADIMQLVCHSAYRTSVALAREKGAFPLFDARAYLAAPFVAKLPEDIRSGIAEHGIRNSHLLAIAPTGSISILAGNVSSGLEPPFAADFERSLPTREGVAKRFQLTDYAVAQWRRLSGTPEPLPPAFVRATEVSPADQLAMQAALQAYVDNAISKTVSVPADFPFDQFAAVYDLAYDMGLKGCTTYRPSAARGQVLSLRSEPS